MASASARARVLRPMILGVLMASLTACSAGTATPGPASSSPVPTVTPSASPSVAGSPAASPTPAPGDAILATTTSTQDSGLLDVLIPAFEKATGYTVKTIAVGSGQAMEMGENGDADVLLVHSPAAERDFVDAGYAMDRRLVMHNWFLVVGPPSDPAGIKGMTSVTDAFGRIAETQSTFVSRGDGSGTETRELRIWKAAGIEPAGDWYLQSGQGMAATLRIASEKAGYTLTDDATWFTTEDVLELDSVVEEDAALVNPYHVIVVNPEKRPRVNAAGASAFADFLLSAQGQAIIGDFGLAEHGRQLFVPDAGRTEADLGLP